VVPVPGAPASFTDLTKRVRPSVVNIYTTAVLRGRPVVVCPFGEQSPFCEVVQAPEQRANSLGTGFIVSADGDILTNNHVVAPEELGGRVADQITVKLDDKRELRAIVVARDPATDLALLKVAATGLSPMSMGDSDALEVGEWVIAVGQPYGLTSTVTAGIVSAKGRHGSDVGGLNRGYYDFIQTDCAINPGNSGGPLVNMRGEAVGINTAINAKAQGLAFAVPINMAKQVLADLKRFGRVQRGSLGIRTVDNPRAYGIDLPSGALVERVLRNGPAARGGVLPGDIIVAFDGSPVEDADRLRFLTANAGVGKSVVVDVVRGAKRGQVRLTTIAD
jgi:serine protease Do